MALYDPFGVDVPLKFDITHTLPRYEVRSEVSANMDTPYVVLLHGQANQSHIVSLPQWLLVTRSMALSMAIEQRPPLQPSAPADITRPAPVYGTPCRWAGGALANIPRGLFCVTVKGGAL